MSKRDYIAIAETILDETYAIKCTVPPYIWRALCKAFKEENPRFNERQFMDYVNDMTAELEGIV